MHTRQAQPAPCCPWEDQLLPSNHMPPGEDQARPGSLLASVGLWALPSGDGATGALPDVTCPRSLPASVLGSLPGKNIKVIVLRCLSGGPADCVFGGKGAVGGGVRQG